MNLPDDCFLAYVVNHEAWYFDANQKAGTLEGRSLGVVAQFRGGGCAWEFVVSEHNIGGGTVKLKMFADSFEAFAQIPEFFQALTLETPESLLRVREILDELGAKDTTDRVSPYKPDPRAELVAKLEEAETELRRYDAEHPVTAS